MNTKQIGNRRGETQTRLKNTHVFFEILTVRFKFYN